MRRLGAALQAHGCGERNHRAVVGAQRQLGVMHPYPTPRAGGVELRAQAFIGTYATSHHQALSSPNAVQYLEDGSDQDVAYRVQDDSSRRAYRRVRQALSIPSLGRAALLDS